MKGIFLFLRKKFASQVGIKEIIAVVKRAGKSGILPSFQRMLRLP
jgi:hypothetical protein